MKVFIIHKKEDLETIKNILEKKQKEIFGLNFRYLDNTSPIWRRSAKKLICKSDFVIYFSGKCFSPNIEWEMETVRKAKIPLYIVPLTPEDSNCDFLFENNEGYGKKPKARIVPLEKINSILREDTSLLSENLFNEKSDDTLLFEQYKLLLETSENLVERRQKTTTTYLAICSILIPVITTMLSFSNALINLLSVSVSVLSIILCVCWKSIITSYGQSNKAKFAIMELIEKKLPVSIFSSEWIARTSFRDKYISFTKKEAVAPIIFLFLDCFFVVGAILIYVLKLKNLF